MSIINCKQQFGTILYILHILIQIKESVTVLEVCICLCINIQLHHTTLKQTSPKLLNNYRFHNSNYVKLQQQYKTNGTFCVKKIQRLVL